jgi:hypothetical protein
MMELRHVRVILPVIALSLAWPTPALAEPIRAPNEAEIRAIREAAELVRSVGWLLNDGSAADNIIDYLEAGEILIDEDDFAPDGNTTRDPVGRDTIALNESLFQGYDQAGIQHARVVVTVASTLVHEKFHAEVQSALLNGMWRLGRAVAGLLPGEGEDVDLVEGTAYGHEFSFLEAAAAACWKQYAMELEEFNLDMSVYNNLVEQWNRAPGDRELADLLLRQIETLLERMGRITAILDKLQIIYEQMRNIGSKWQDPDIVNGSRRRAAEMLDAGAKGLAEVQRLRQAFEEIRQTLLQHRRIFTEAILPVPLVPQDGAPFPVFPRDSIDREIERLQDRYDEIRSEDGAKALGPARDYFRAFAHLLGRRDEPILVNVQMRMTQVTDFPGYDFGQAPLSFTLWIEDRKVEEVVEDAGAFADLVLSLEDASVVRALAGRGNLRATIAEQLASGEITLTPPHGQQPSRPRRLRPESATPEGPGDPSHGQRVVVPVGH